MWAMELEIVEQSEERFVTTQGKALAVSALYLKRTSQPSSTQ